MHIIMPGYCLQYTTHQGKKQPLQYYKINLTGARKMSHISTIYMLWRWARGVHMQGSDYIIGCIPCIGYGSLRHGFLWLFLLAGYRDEGWHLGCLDQSRSWMSNVHLSDNCVTFLVSPSVGDHWWLDKVAFLDEMRDVLLGHQVVIWGLKDALPRRGQEQ